MKKVFTTIAKWIKSIFAKQKHAELIKHEMSIDEKKKVVSQFNEERMKRESFVKGISDAYKQSHPEVLSETVRNSKPGFYDATKNETFTCDFGSFNLTQKQFFFINKMKELNSDIGVNAHDVCRAFIENKLGEINSSTPKRHLKHDHHRSTFNYLSKVGLITKTKKNTYKVNF
jgi:hypothetical protein